MVFIKNKDYVKLENNSMIYNIYIIFKRNQLQLFLTIDL